jgi:uncharacterized membrane protein
VLAAITTCGMMVRHWFNLRGRGENNTWLLPVSALLIVSLAYITKPVSLVADADGAELVEFVDVQRVLLQRCTPCHAAEPSHPAFAAPPKNVVFDTPASIGRYAELIHKQSVQSKIMPLGNLTQMTDDERLLLGAWYRQGAAIE